MVNNFKLIRADGYTIAFHCDTLQIYRIDKHTESNAFFDVLNNGMVKLSEHNKIGKEILDNIKENQLGGALCCEELKNEDISLQTVVLPISGDCNLHCSYCFARTTSKGFGFKDMSFTDIEKNIDYILKNSSREAPCTLVFFGGEPMLRLDLIKHTIHYVESNYPTRKVEYSITTNGTIVNDEIIKLLKDKEFGLLISLDGPPHITDHRRFANGTSSFDIVMKNIKKFKAENARIQLRATIPSDCKDIVGLYKFFENLQIPFSVVFAYKSANETDLSSFAHAEQHLKKQFEGLYCLYENLLKSGTAIYCQSIAESIDILRFRRKRLYLCNAGRNFFAIAGSGDIFSCEHLAYSKDFSIGNIDTGIDYAKLRKLQAPSVNNISGCTECWAKYLCVGGCPTTKIPFKDVSYSLNEDDCFLQKEYWTFIIKLFNQLQNE